MFSTGAEQPASSVLSVAIGLILKRMLDKYRDIAREIFT